MEWIDKHLRRREGEKNGSVQEKKLEKSYDPIRVRVKSPVLDGQGLTFIDIQCWQQVLELIAQAT